MKKADYKAGFVLLGVSVLMIGITLNYFSAEITDMYLATDLSAISKGKGIGSFTPLQTECAEIAIKIISVSADIGGILAIIYGFTSKRNK